MTSTGLLVDGIDDSAALPFSPSGLHLLSDMNCICWRRTMAADGTISYSWLSDAALGILGFRPDQLRANDKGALTVIHWADRDLHVEAIKASAVTLLPYREAFRAITASGETRWLDGTAHPRRAADGRIIWDGVWMDATQRMRTEDRQQMLMDNAEDCIFVLTGDEGITWSNAAAERNFGYLNDELAGRCFHDLILGENRPPCSCEPMDLLESQGKDNSGSRQEVIGRRSDGSTFPFEMTVSEVRRDGRLSLVVIGRDISRRREAERLLAESEQRLRVTFAAASLGIVVLDKDGVIQFYNPAFESMAGDGYDDLLGVNIHAFVPAESMPVPSRLPPPGMSFCLVCQPLLVDGKEHHWRLTGTQFLAAPDSQEQSLLYFIEDVTETTRMNQERRQLELLLQEGHKLEALGRLAGGIAHELNNMLGPILMGAEMVARTTQLDPKNADRVQRIIEASKHSRDIVRNVLAYCRKETKALGIIDLAALFEGFASLTSTILPPSILVELHREIESATVMADAGQMQQVLLNLAINARDAMFGSGTLSLSLRLMHPEELLARFQSIQRMSSGPAPNANPLASLDFGTDHVALGVGDTGTGMTPAVAAKIFDPFFTTKPVGQGTGLGLSMVQGIVKAMGGAIVVDSEVGKGTTFHVILPQVGPDKA
ncbi:PAS domain S-box protein [Paramagnetospirillum kuznetsovii]|nr:PAS domain S-box protein [Paramagnetospirillum kuznetsovii]